MQRKKTETIVRPTANSEATVSRILTEEVRTLSEARKDIAEITGKRPDKATMSRWIHRGVGGVKLEAIRLGNQLLTSRQACTRFIVTRTEKTVGAQ